MTPDVLRSGLARRDRPLSVGLVGPHLRGGLCEVVREVLGGARVVRAVDGGDREVGKRGVRVGRDDRRVVPLGDGSGEDAGDRGGVEVQGVDALEVEVTAIGEM